jgi:hypothetical protein
MSFLYLILGIAVFTSLLLLTLAVERFEQKG